MKKKTAKFNRQQFKNATKTHKYTNTNTTDKSTNKRQHNNNTTTQQHQQKHHKIQYNNIQWVRWSWSFKDCFDFLWRKG